MGVGAVKSCWIPAGLLAFLIKSRGNSGSGSAICGSPAGAGYISTGFPPASTISPSMPLSLGINPGQWLMTTHKQLHTQKTHYFTNTECRPLVKQPPRCNVYIPQKRIEQKLWNWKLLLYRLSTTTAEEPRQEKYMYMLSNLSQDRDLCSWERDGIGIEHRGIGTGAGQLLAGMGGSGTGKLVPCNTLSWDHFVSLRHPN